METIEISTEDIFDITEMVGGTFLEEIKDIEKAGYKVVIMKGDEILYETK